MSSNGLVTSLILYYSEMLSNAKKIFKACKCVFLFYFTEKTIANQNHVLPLSLIFQAHVTQIEQMFRLVLMAIGYDVLQNTPQSLEIIFLSYFIFSYKINRQSKT